MAISRVPGYSLLANLDRQGTDMGISSSGLYVTYWDVVNYRFGINNSNPQQALDVSGNILISSGHLYTSANTSFDVGTISSWWRTVYTQNVQATNLTGALQTASQPNITTLGTIGNLITTGNTYMIGNVTVNGNLIVGNITTSGLSGNITGNLTGYVLQGNQPYITTLSNISVSNVTITGGVFNLNGNVSATNVNANQIYENNYRVLTENSNLQVTGDIVGYGTYNSINLQLNTTGVSEGAYGSASHVAQIYVNNEGRVLTASNVAINQVQNLHFSNTTMSSTTEMTLSTTAGNIYLNAGGTGVVQFTGNDAVGLPAGDDSTRPTVAAIGYTRYNTVRQSIEYFDGSTWTAPGAAIISSEVINPDGTSNVYTLGSNVTVDSIFVSINGTLQQPVYSYTIVNNNQIQFTEIPLTSDKVEVRFISVSATTVSGLRYGAITEVALDIANVTVTGNILPSSDVTYDLGSNTKAWKSLYIDGTIVRKSANTLVSTTSITTVDSYSATSYRTAKYIVQAVHQTNVQSSEVLITHNGTTAYSTTYGILTTGNVLGNISATLSGDSVLLQYTATTANTYIILSKDLYAL